ncbi:recombinase family protein [Inconstantimicrobium porci]|uniref:recombinase family protein n=1 Tax=Inconstantimicrobium porci TaxID=2652291 RepID=UPI00197D0F65|nr:recombinase family protein [Inconstantimicrobium porci]
MIYGYARVSTKGQAHNGKSLESQEKLLKENVAEIIYKDKFSDNKSDRPEFNKLLNTLQYGEMLMVLSWIDL